MSRSDSQQFWDRIATKYAARPVSDEAAYQHKLEVTRGYLRPDMEVMEFGCGTGSTAIAHAPFARHIRATDISGAMIAIARDKAEKAGVTNVAFEQADIMTMTVPDGSLDAVMGHSILHLVPERDAVIARVFAMLKPGGVFVSSTACLGDAMWFLRPVLPLMRALGKAPPVVFFTEAALVESIRRARFSIDHHWRPGRWAAVFIVALKPA